MREYLFGKSQAQLDAEKAVAEKAFDESIKNGTAGRVVNDKEEQKRVQQYRKEEAARVKQHLAETKLLAERREQAKLFELQQQLERPTERHFVDAPKNLGSRDRDAVKAVHQKMQSAASYKGVLGLFKKPEQKDPASVLEATCELRSK